MPRRRGPPAWLLPVLAFLLVTALAAPLAAEEPSDAGLGEAVAWLDAKGFTPPASRPFVRVFTGAWAQDADGNRQPTPAYGLLVEDEGARFEVLTTTLLTLELEPTPPDTPQAERVGWEEADLRAHVSSVVAAWSPGTDGQDDHAGLWRRWSTRMDRQGEALVLAWMCAQQGHEAEAARVWAAGEALEPGGALFAAARAQIELALYWRILDAFGDAEISWTRLLADATDYVRRFPESASTDTVRRMRATLVGTAASASAPEPAVDAPLEERAQWLVVQLVTQHGLQDGQPGRCDVFADPRGEDSPAHRLLALGYDAVPALIASLDDLRFTRSIGYVRDFYFSHHVLRVCDVALDVLESIAGQSFWQPPYFSEHVSQEPPEVRAKVAEDVRAWWQEAEAQGEEAMLVEAVEQGGGAAAYLAQRLLRKYPERALPALRAGLAAAVAAPDRAHLVQVAAGVERPEVTELLLEILAEDPALLVRTTAAIELLEGRPDAAIDRMVAEWNQAPCEEGAWWGRDAENLHLAFLVGCGDVRGIRAIRARMAVCGVPWRVEAIATLVNGNGYAALPYTLTAPDPERGGKRAPEAVLADVEALLLERLADRAEVMMPTGMSFSHHDRFVLPMVCDHAAWALAGIFPDRYPAFDPGAALATRDAWIAKVLERLERDAPPPRFDVPEGADDDPARACRVTHAHVEGATDTDSPAGDLLRKVRALEGGILTPETWVDLLLAAVEAVAPGGVDCTLRLRRPAAAAGIRITLRVQPDEETSEEESLSYGWGYSVGTQSVSGGGGGAALDYKRAPEAWSEHLEAMRALLAAPPDTILVGEVRMTRR